MNQRKERFKYSVTVETTTEATYTVEATNEDAASFIANRMSREGEKPEMEDVTRRVIKSCKRKGPRYEARLICGEHSVIDNATGLAVATCYTKAIAEVTAKALEEAAQ